MTMHVCPAPGCVVELPYHIAFCRPHWYQVPRPLRSAVMRAWRAWLNAQPAESHALYQAYLEVRQQTIDSLTPATALGQTTEKVQ